MKSFVLAGHEVQPGERKQVMIKTAALYDFTQTGIPVEIVHGKSQGPVLFVSAAIHGDEINGVDIVTRLLKNKRLKQLKGTLIAIPIVNIFGFNTKSRYLPDRRDLNRCFPGSENGPLANQLAYTFMNEIVSQATHGIDLHTGAIHRSNLPQIRGCFEDKETLRLARAFGAPVMMHSDLRDGSLREAARENNIPMLLFEAGEALRFSESVSRIGLKGTLNVMESIGMLECENGVCDHGETAYAKSSHWLRAPHSGILKTKKKLGDFVKANQVIAVISDPFGKHRFELKAKHDGIVIGMSLLPLFNAGDAVFHIATFENSQKAENKIDQYQDHWLIEPDTFTI